METIGRYQIIEQIGSGAMGTVYKARDPMMGRDVAVKTLLPHVIGGPQAADFRERFFREARAAGRLAHPGIVTVYDVSENEGMPFLVMEFVAGRTLQSSLESGERLDLPRIRDYGIQLAEALAYAHHNNVIHRDIKPANILITPEGRVKIADFGVARLIDAQVTSTGYLLGTPAFMAPEQFTGAPIDGRADLFAAGVVIYWMATGDKPFSGDSLLSVQYKVVHTEPVPPRKLNPAMPRELESVILKSLAKDPAERYQSGEQLATDLRNSATGETVFAKTVAMSANDASTLVVESKPFSNTVAQTTAVAQTPAAPGPPTQASGEQSISVPPRKRNGWLVATVLIAVFVAGAAAARLRTKLQTAPTPQQSPTTVPPGVADPLPTPPSASATPELASESTKEPPKAAAVKPPLPKPAAERPQPAKFAGIQLEITAQATCSVVFEAEGHPTEALNMKAGDTTMLHADQQASLIVTNPGALQLRLNGKSVSLGQRRAGRFIVTPESIEPYTATAKPGFPGAIPGLPPNLPDLVNPFGRGGPAAVGTASRQKELAQEATSVHLLLQSSAIPEFFTLVVRVDNGVFFRRDATASVPEGLDQIPRRYPSEPVTSVPLAEERLIPPGSHQIQVTLLLGTVRFAQHDLTADFNSGQRQTLGIEFVRDNQGGSRRGGSIPRLQVTLE